MADATKIEWTDATVNFWWGCTKVGPGCDHCYAETQSNRFTPGHWGVGAPRRKIASAGKLLNRLDNDYAWWAADAQIGKLHPNLRRRVFVQSMSDLFDLEVPLEWFAEAWGKIVQCDRLDIQIVTKRISAVEKRLAAIGVNTWPKHAGLMITVVNQAEFDRDVPRLRSLKRRMSLPWIGLSAEPLLGPIVGDFSDLDWIIVGGESGRGARPMHPDWARSIRDQCAAAGTAFFFKQHGDWIAFYDRDIDDPDWRRCPRVDDQMGRGAERYHNLAGGTGFHGERVLAMRNVGKAKAGRLLDGVEHNAMPRAA
ncbi:Phage Gp37Gp68 family protein [Bosea sp. LC85]|uniref:DUF5131 family protein n=1 Tax=Bosea sp. LC85 TaxID=1502851 RepID=UPI0004E32BDF|nr:DUF5131 family protein [Bosea sp. LC85]KFC64016.1 Phage Gp37Gp68 family protein [Bosea sp. LC85]